MICQRALLALLLCHPVPALASSASNSAPVAQRSTGQIYYDLHSHHAGRTYRLFVRVPTGAPPPEGFPVVYILDGNWHFNTAADANAMQSAVGEIDAAIIVGIGYPESDQLQILRRRWEDLAPAGDPAALPPFIRGLDPELGGAENFLAFLNEEVKPLVSSVGSANPACQTLYGHSLGGLFVLHTLFTAPGSFQAYVAASPAIWWNDSGILREATAYTRRAERGELNSRLLLTVGELEQRSDIADRAVAERVSRARMRDNVADLAAILSQLAPSDLRVSTIVYEGETHNSVIPGTISRALRFGLDCPGKARAGGDVS